MIRNIGPVIYLALFLFLNASLYSVSDKVLNLNSNNDHGLWCEQSFRSKLGCDWSAQLNMNQRWGSDYTLFWYHSYGIIFQYDLMKPFNSLLDLTHGGLLKSLSIGPGIIQYQLIRKNTMGKYRWVWVSRPLLEMNFTVAWAGWTLNNRIRGEYQSYNSSHYKNYGNARIRLVLGSPWKFTCLKISPYVSNEFFLRNNTYHSSHPLGLVGGLYQNRLRIGVTAELIKDVFSTVVYWQWRALKQVPGIQPGYFNTYQFGVLVDVSF